MLHVVPVVRSHVGSYIVVYVYMLKVINLNYDWSVCLSIYNASYDKHSVASRLALRRTTVLNYSPQSVHYNVLACSEYKTSQYIHISDRL